MKESSGGVAGAGRRSCSATYRQHPAEFGWCWTGLPRDHGEIATPTGRRVKLQVSITEESELKDMTSYKGLILNSFMSSVSSSVQRYSCKAAIQHE